MEEDFLNEFRQTIESGEKKLLAISEAQSEMRLAPEKWSARELLGHLIDSASNNHHRFVLAQLSEDLVFPSYDQDKWVEVQKYQQASWPLLIQLWKAYNLHLLHVMSVTPEDMLRKRRNKHNLYEIAWRPVEKRVPISLKYLMRDYLYHLQHHLNQIFALSAAQS
ncbi:MAG: DinB family protein [candidate division KSB1 bacterium]|nr:DinB family protein [candidate division KSB1 bacterium]MDZ7273697.1 DinB family protein [candidate division KSB1 bacterium]MDZ7285853.1 DinB family protein [candidate division KSB1 bacterium]MDZ7298885.1 DinB family protein [candidate division KSB1 bacterium]MDZ7309084.1 DinB family protein [candidate division KSB1 bacterium]